jgi:hypothetical protein
MADPFKDNIEAIIDRVGLHNFIALTSVICFEKAEHIATEWQDTTLAKDWAKVGRLLDNLLEQV